MSVIVKDMKFPNNCAECERWSICKCLKEYKDYESILYAVDDGDLVRADECPLAEIPTPHGDLVDLSDMVHPNDSMRRMTIDEQLRRTCEGWSADRKQYVVIEGSET